MATKAVDVGVQGMTCANGSSRVKRKLNKLDGVLNANVNLATERATVRLLPAQLSSGDIKEAVEAAGCTVLDTQSQDKVDTKKTVAQAIVKAAQSRGVALTAPTDFEAAPGYGFSALVDGWRVQAGADRYMRQLGLELSPNLADRLADEGKTPLYAAVDGRLAATIAVADTLKEGSVEAVKSLHDLGLKVAMVTGNNARTAQAIAKQLGIDEVLAEVLPDGKVDAVKALQGEGRKVAFVGDGINDAPALAQADVGIAISTGTDVAIEAADVIVMSGDLRGVPNALGISRATLNNIKQNLFWAFFYNILLIPVAAGVLYPTFGILLSPILAAAAMGLSDLFVVGNALRLKRFKPPVPHAFKEARPALVQTPSHAA